jgi:hypothetical protein
MSIAEAERKFRMSCRSDLAKTYHQRNLDPQLLFPRVAQ